MSTCRLSTCYYIQFSNYILEQMDKYDERQKMGYLRKYWVGYQREEDDENLWHEPVEFLKYSSKKIWSTDTAQVEKYGGHESMHRKMLIHIKPAVNYNGQN